MTNSTTCSVDSCYSSVKGRGLCNKHLIRLRRHGDPLAYFPNKSKSCSVEGCDNEHRARGLCVKHWCRWREHGDPLTVLPHVNPVMSGESNPRWVGADATYGTVHWRMWRDDRASNYACDHCGVNQADDWSYDHADPDEKQSERGPYSLSREHYAPLCHSCHVRFDKAVRKHRATHLDPSAP